MTTTIDPDVRAGGILPNIDEESYHRDTTTLSVSGMKTLLRSPARFLHERTHPRPATDAMDVGSIIHELILRSGDTRIRVADAYDWKTPKVRARRDDWRGQNLIAIHRGQLRDAARVRQAVMANPYVADIFSTGLPEQSLYWTDPATGVRLRGRVDWLRTDVLVDVKTTEWDITDDHALGKLAANLDWPMQAANYTDGHETITGRQVPFLFVVIQVTAPYTVRIFQPSTVDLETGRRRVAEAIEVFTWHETHGYPVYGNRIEPLPVAPWYGRTN